MGRHLVRGAGRHRRLHPSRSGHGAKLVYFLTLPPVGVVLWTWVQFLNGTATDFSGLLIVNCGLPLLFLSLVGLITTLAAREPFDA